MTMRELLISANEGGQRIDKFLVKKFKTMPLSLVYKYLRTKKIKINGKKAAPGDFINEGDKLSLYISDEFFSADNENLAFLHMTPNVTVVYEDENIIIADKPAGMLTHSDDKEGYNTLINHIKAYLYKKGEYNLNEAFAPALCNRIDRNTCGLVIAAKNAAALRDMNRRIKERAVTKRYLAVVHGKPIPESGTLSDYIFKDRKVNKVYINKQKGTAGEKSAVTKYRVLETKDDVSLIEAELITGRTHQIRAQLAAAGYPLRGDGKYSVNKKDRELGYSHQSLCSYKIKFEKTDADSLSYLDGKVFYATAPNFLKPFKYRF